MRSNAHFNRQRARQIAASLAFDSGTKKKGVYPLRIGHLFRSDSRELAKKSLKSLHFDRATVSADMIAVWLERAKEQSSRPRT